MSGTGREGKRRAAGWAFWGLAAASWAAVTAIDLAGLADDILADARIMAAVTTLAALQYLLALQAGRAAGRLDRTYRAIARNVRARPDDPEPTPPVGFPALRKVSGPMVRPDAPAPPAGQHAGRHTRRGLRATAR